MKKTIPIHISGLLFNIDEDAWQRLSQYMDSIRMHFATMEGHEDIIADIEARIAELLQRKINEQKQVISLADIQEVINALGQPFEMDTDQEATVGSQNAGTKRPKRLFRDAENKKLGGVAAGIAAYFNIDALWIRLIFVFLTLTSGVGVFIYIALWIFIPEAVTIAEKLEMRGEPVNVANIEQSFRQEFESVKGKFSTYAESAREGINRSARHAGAGVSRMNDPVMLVIKGIARFIGIVFGLIFLFIGLLLILIAGAAFLGWDDFNLFSDMEMPLAGGEYLYQLLLSGPLSVAIAPVALGAFIAIPLIMLVYAGLRLLVGETFKIPGLSNVATGLWIASVVGLFYVGTTLVIDMQEFASVDDQQKTFSTNKDKPVYIYVNADESLPKNEDLAFFDQRYIISEKNKDGQIAGIPRIYFERTESTAPIIEPSRRARGKSYDKARERANAISYPVQFSDSSMTVQRYFFFSEKDKLRDQKITVTVKLPEGQLVWIDKKIEPIVSGYLQDKMQERNDNQQLWVMTADGLQPYAVNLIK